jgi:hypothetical protein
VGNKKQDFFENFSSGHVQISVSTELGNSGAALIDDQGDFPLHRHAGCV